MCLALTGSSRDCDGGFGGGATAARAAAAAGLLDEEPFFQHFYGRLVGVGDEARTSPAGDCGDGSDARVLEEV